MWVLILRLPRYYIGQLFGLYIGAELRYWGKWLMVEIEGLSELTQIIHQTRESKKAKE